MRSWVGVGEDDPFGLDNLPYGSHMGPDRRLRTVVRIGAHMLDLTGATVGTEHEGLFELGTLDTFLAAGPTTWSSVRAQLTRWLSEPEHQPSIEKLLIPIESRKLRLPFAVADYVDFYASEDHASNVGRMFRPDAAALTPNWKHLPIGYHGRSGTIVVSGTDVRRPSGQYRGPDGEIVFGPSTRLDIEAEIAFVVGVGSERGTPVSTSEFRRHVFGLCLLNDWSARDIQAWEYVPLGPFLGKSFATSVSAWLTPLDALRDAWTAPPPREHEPLPYLREVNPAAGLDIALEIRVNGARLANPAFAGMYWTPAQMLAHMTVNGASLRTGDVFASGTVSGPEPRQRGSLLELSWNGTEPIDLGGGATRRFLEDGDEVVITASAPAPNGRISLGEVAGRVVA
ncbi:MAG: fumarylacetoacetase [Actinomycetota bacterium]|nr:fumarylacetoacetase [Actinomycetota bacterium]